MPLRNLLFFRDNKLIHWLDMQPLALNMMRLAHPELITGQWDVIMALAISVLVIYTLSFIMWKGQGIFQGKISSYPYAGDENMM